MMGKDIFDRLKTAGAVMGTRDPADYSFMISVADAVRVGRHVDVLELALHRIAGHGNITGAKAREIAVEVLGLLSSDRPVKCPTCDQR
jgi:hypothetical protein